MHHHIRNLLKVAQETLKSIDEMVASLEHEEFIKQMDRQEEKSKEEKSNE